MPWVEVTLFVLLTALVATSVGAFVAWILGPRPRMIATWSGPPLIKIAENCPARVASFARVAATELRTLGLKTMVGRSSSRMQHEDGAIIVGGRMGWATKHHAGQIEIRVRDGTREIRSALVYLPGDVSYECVLHELLIAMGFMTVWVPGHVLSRRTQDIGQSREGVALGVKQAMGDTLIKR